MRVFPVFPRSLTIARWATLFALLPLLLAGCSSTKHLKYEEFICPLDGKSELKVSTVPAWFPKTIKQSWLFEQLITHDAVNFEVHVRDAAAKVGSNPHVESIRIHHFSYQFPGEQKVELLKDYDASFWMQGNSNTDKDLHPPIPYITGGMVHIDIKLTLNGTDYAFSGEMPAREFTRMGIGRPSRIGH